MREPFWARPPSCCPPPPLSRRAPGDPHGHGVFAQRGRFGAGDLRAAIRMDLPLPRAAALHLASGGALPCDPGRLPVDRAPALPVPRRPLRRRLRRGAAADRRSAAFRAVALRLRRHRHLRGGEPPQSHPYDDDGGLPGARLVRLRAARGGAAARLVPGARGHLRLWHAGQMEFCHARRRRCR